MYQAYTPEWKAMKFIFFKLIFVFNHFIRSFIQASEKYTFLRNHKHVDSSFKFNYLLSTYEIQKPSKLIIQKGVMFGDFCNIMLWKNSSLVIKEGVFMNRYCSINCLGEIVIGSNSIFGEGVKIYIGSENKLFSLSGSTLVIAPYMDSGNKIIGAVGVIGPTRLNYGRIVPIVDYTANLIGRTISRMSG